MTAASRVISSIKRKFEGGVSFTVDWNSVLREGAQAMLQNIAPKKLNRESALYGGVIDGIVMYYCPTELAAPNGIFDNLSRLNYSYLAPNQFQYKISNGSVEKIFTITNKNGARFILINGGQGGSLINLNDMDDASALTADMTLVNNTYDYLSGSSAVQGTFTDALTKVGATFPTVQSFANHKFGTVLLPIALTNVDKVASIKFRLKTDLSNYYTYTATDALDYLIEGWNIVRINIKDGVATGSPDISTITRWEVEITMDSGQSQVIIIDRVMVQTSFLYRINFTSSLIFVDKDTLVRKVEIDDDEDLIDLDEEEMEIFKYECCRVVIQEATQDSVNSQEQQRFDRELARKYDLYYIKNPSNEMPFSYNILPEINRSDDIPQDAFLERGTSIEVIESDSSAITNLTVYNEIPTGTINGVNTSFTLAHTPNPAGSLQLTVNGQFLTVGVDYTLSSSTITFIFAPQVGDIIRARYDY